MKSSEPVKRNLCKMCRHSKDHFRDCCFCTEYGIIIAYGKTNCKGYQPIIVKRKDDRA